jgi:hypothetical protein
VLLSERVHVKRNLLKLRQSLTLQNTVHSIEVEGVGYS